MFDVVQAVDPIKRIEHCPLPSNEQEGDTPLRNHKLHHLCPLHQRLDDALGAVEKIFRDTTLTDLVTAAKAGNPFCHSNPAMHERHKLHVAG